MPTYKLVAALVFAVVSLGTALWLFLLRGGYARFFDPAIDDAEQALATFAREANGKFVPSLKRWRQLSPLSSSLYTYTDDSGGRRKAYRDAGGVELTQAGFPTQIGWVIVALKNGFALLPRVRVYLPLGASFQSLHDPPSSLLSNPWSLWSHDVYDIADHGPRVELTPRERHAFDALSAQACRVFVSTETIGNPITGAMPKSYPLYVEAWGAPRHGEPSPRALERSLHGWREDFGQKELRELVAATLTLAQSATVS